MKRLPVVRSYALRSYCLLLSCHETVATQNGGNRSRCPKNQHRNSHGFLARVRQAFPDANSILTSTIASAPRHPVSHRMRRPRSRYKVISNQPCHPRFSANSVLFFSALCVKCFPFLLFRLPHPCLSK